MEQTIIMVSEMIYLLKAYLPYFAIAFVVLCILVFIMFIMQCSFFKHFSVLRKQNEKLQNALDKLFEDEDDNE